MAKRIAMCSASFSRVGLSDESEGACARESGEPRLERLRIEFLIGTFAGTRDLREHLHDALQLVLVQGHQSRFDGHGARACAGRTASPNSGGGVAPAAGLAAFGAFAYGVCQIPSARAGIAAACGT